MTRVILSPFVLEYCEGMAELVRAVGEKPTISGVAPRSRRINPFLPQKELPALRLDGLLSPPRIELLDPYLSPLGPEAGGIVQIVTSGDFGVMDVYVTLKDEQGQPIEGGFAIQDNLEEDDWYYFPSASLHSGASVTVRAIATDPLGGIGVQDETVTV